MTQGYRIQKDVDGQPIIDQHTINGWDITWNPDDSRFYVAKLPASVATFKRFSNAVYYAKNH